MGGVILVFILIVLVAILVTPAIRNRLRGNAPPEPPESEPHEVVVHRLDDHRGKKKPGDDGR